LLIASYKSVYDEGLQSFFDRGGLVFLLVLIPVFSLAPLSLWVYIKAGTQKHKNWGLRSVVNGLLLKAVLRT
jgi:hypothetical protein